MRPWVGFMPTRPLNEAGMRVEPPPSLAVAMGTIPRATAAAEPPLEPPGVRSRFQGLRVTPQALVLVYWIVPNSGAAVLPTKIAPAARSRDRWMESSVAGGPPLYRSEPWIVGMPAQSSRSFTPNGTPRERTRVVTARDPIVDLGRGGARPVQVEMHEGVERFVVASR